MPARFAAIDCARVVAMIAVLAIHSHYYQHTGDYAPWECWAAIALNQAARFAVPFFFIMAGYFLGRGVRRGQAPVDLANASLRRLGGVFLVWSIVFIAIDLALGRSSGTDSASTAADLGGVVHRVFAGARIHIWFIPALLAGVLVVLACQPLGPRVQLLIGGLLYVLGLAGGAYSELTGLDLGMNSRNGPFFSSLFVGIGFQMGYRDFRPRLRAALMLFGLGIVLQAAEVVVLTQAFDVSPFGIDFVAGTVPFALGFAWLTLAVPSFGEGTALSRAGALTLGVYLLHLDVEMLIGPINPVRGFAGQLLLVGTTFLATLVVIWPLSRCRLTRQIVS